MQFRLQPFHTDSSLHCDTSGRLYHHSPSLDIYISIDTPTLRESNSPPQLHVVAVIELKFFVANGTVEVANFLRK